jgi:hypothetical protein
MVVPQGRGGQAKKGHECNTGYDSPADKRSRFKPGGHYLASPWMRGPRASFQPAAPDYRRRPGSDCNVTTLTVRVTQIFSHAFRPANCRPRGSAESCGKQFASKRK